MTTKFVQRCISALTFVMVMVLLGVIVFVWIQFIPNTYKSKQQYTRKLNATIPEESITRITPKNSKDYTNEPANIVMVEKMKNANIELVKPMKTNPSPPELMESDVVYDKPDHNGKPTLRHRNGHFRHKTAEVWDQHPSYEIKAFGKKMVLELENNKKFVPPDLHITTHLHENYTQRVRHDPRMASCFYTGKIRDDPGSAVSVSLCNGMTGYIRTSDENYYISPEKPWNTSSDNFIHRMERVSFASKEFNDVISSESDCDTNDRHTLIEDDVGPESAEKPYKHIINKRDILFDIIDDQMESKEKNQVYRTTRNTDWMENYEKSSHEYFIKLLIVADKTMVQYHKTDDGLKHYILTLMSHVSLLFKDASIGNAISIAVVDIAILYHGEFSHYSNSQGALKKFCDWKQKYTVEHSHDAALLLTRDTICKNNSANLCTTLGLAEVGSMCSHSGGCAIVKDNGLSASYTIAHELGHLLGMPHDDNKSCRNLKNDTAFNSIMSKTITHQSGRWMWSACAKYYLNEFLQTKRARCLSRPPSKSLIISNNIMLPGEIFEVNKQCELEFGTGSRLCSYMPFCGSLWCTHLDEGGCKSNNLPWAEGTPCSSNGWCHHGKCTDLDRNQFAPVDGGWGPWQPWSPCSRTCGGGIRNSKRHCDSPTPENGGEYCNGPSIRYESCATADCDINSPEFRAVQCAEYNGNSMSIPNITNDVEWIPQYGSVQPEEVCRLYCRPTTSKIGYMLADKVLDGTKCGLNSFDVCVNGICKPGGCDNRLESELVLDDCGICGGDNIKCQEISGTYNIQYPSLGYNRVVRIPKGSSNLDIRQRAFNDSDIDANYLSLVDGESGEYILNGNYMANTNEEDVVFGSLIIKYSGANASIERITTPKNHKLTKDLVVEVLCVGNITPPDISYRYLISRDDAPKYNWRLYEKQWSKCNSICSGTQFMRPVCVELASNTYVSDVFCEHLDIHSVIQKQDCNTHCQLTWNIKMKGACSGAHCGKGVRNVYYNCMKVYTKKAGYSELVDEKHCDILPKPPSMETCETVCDTLRWEFSKWSKCSKTCGGGIQHRTAHCVNNNTRIDDSHCNNDEKVTEQICNTNRCPIWMTQYSPCSVSCGGGYREATSHCRIGGRIYSDMSCDIHQRPPDKEPCNQQPCIEWTAEPWTECSVTCGSGIEMQRYRCRRQDNQRIVNDVHCKKAPKPNDVTRICEMAACHQLDNKSRYHYDVNDNSINDYDQTLTFEWVAGDWSTCSKSCDGGTKYLIYYCRNKLGQEDEQLCNYKLKPNTKMQCNINSCPKWKFGDWSPTCDMNCEKHRQVRCMDDFSGVIEDNKCNVTEKPTNSTKCPLFECPNQVPRTYFTSKENHEKRYVWKVGRWKQCSNSCGKGTRRRHLNCEDTLNDIIVVDSLCKHLPKPKIIKPCERFNCKYAWIDDHWSSCSASCGPGIKTRNVSCHRVHRGGIIDPVPLPNIYNTERIHHKNYCSMYKKPNTTMKCLVSHCTDEYVWQPGEWKPCSHTCGRRARQIRPIYCVNVKTKQRVQRYYCPKELRPPRKRKCNNFRCLPKSCKEVKHFKRTRQDGEFYISVKNRPVRIYCHKMDTSTPEEFISLQSTSTNYAEFYDKRLVKSDTCQNYKKDNWVEVGSNITGLTNFKKVKLNITSLQIIGDDYTFSTLIKGVRIPYGTAGDCYSSLTNCVQGRFSIDLSSTSFRLTENVNWHHIGYNSSSHIRKLESRTSGKCGGFCGRCYPDPSIGLQVEITHN